MQNRLVNSSSTHSIFQHSPPGFRAPRLDFYSHALEVALFHQQFIIRQRGAFYPSAITDISEIVDNIPDPHEDEEDDCTDEIRTWFDDIH